MKNLQIPTAPSSIQKGIPLKKILDKDAIMQLGSNLKIVHKNFNASSFIKESLNDIEQLSILERGKKIALTLKKYLPDNYSEAMKIILASLTPPLENTENNGLAVFFYLPHVCFISEFGLDKKYNKGKDPFEISMKGQYELTQRFSAEFSIRHFLIDQPGRTFEKLYEWMNDSNPHVRRLCSEGARPRLPWAIRIPSLIKDPSPSLLMLEKLKNDENIYVRRSVANHVGDIAKDNPELAFRLCNNWLGDASHELKWVIRHALRYPAKKGNKEALKIRKKAI